MIRRAASKLTLRRHAYLCVVLFLVATSSAFAQFNSAVQGTVQDNSGGAVATATVTLTNVDNKVTQTATATGSGVYRFSSLAPGNYRILAAATGFSSTNTAFTQEIIARRRSGETLQLKALTERLNEARKENERRQQNVDRYRLQEDESHLSKPRSDSSAY